MDGTLVGTERQWLAVGAALLPEGTPQAAVESLAGMGFPEASEALTALGADPAAVTEAALDAAFTARVRAEGVSVRPGALELLDAARALGVPIALVTASERHLAEHVVGAALGAWRFAVMVAGAEAGAGKPAPDPYLKAAAELGVAAEDCLAVEDTLTGVTAAVAAGCRVVAVPSVAGSIAAGERVTLRDTLVGFDLASA
ncbi:hypothetical protein BIV57_12940 [Mangrovactinospora gilvigrisea]|uniref:Hydrolase n=2 Tax=Mangrovactinospora gilvigrisea TaxID=1428644 RepID=A0A1J7BUE9_9ACTN|nr:hypothetical protein BIV57_12940 [Mangrovactinospora gilvigrisea]